jgi:glucose uptake protein
LFQPETYAISLALMLTTMLCWGSWANTMKLCPGYRFQLFYWDYVIGLIAGAVLWGVTLGSLGSVGRPFFADIAHTDQSHMLFALLGGILFNIANLLLVAAIDIAGLAVAFPVGIGLALVVGAIVLDAMAYRLRETERQSLSMRGVVISLIAGLLMGSFYPFVSRSMSGHGAAGPYAASLFFVLGVALCAIPTNYLLMRRPLDGSTPVAMAGYPAARGSYHWWGILGGVIWCTGATFNFVASRAHLVGPAVSYSIGQGATMISAAWGVFIWKEFATAPQRAKVFLGWMFLLFVLGLSAIALAPILWK